MSDQEIEDISARRYHNCPVCRDLCCGSEPSSLCCLCYRVRRRTDGAPRSCRFCRDKIVQSLQSGADLQSTSTARQPVHIHMPEASATEALQVLEEFLQENRGRALLVKGIVEGVADLLGTLGRDQDPDVLNRLNDRAQSLSDSVEALSTSFSSLVQDYLQINDTNAARFIWNLRRRVAMSALPLFDEQPAEPMVEGEPMSVFREVCRRIGRARREVDNLDGRLNALMSTVNYILGPSIGPFSSAPAPTSPAAVVPATPPAPPVPTTLPTSIPAAAPVSPTPAPTVHVNIHQLPSRPPKDCGHNHCHLSIPLCCSCSDRRPTAERYHVYIDGQGWVEEGTRDAHYCSGCRPSAEQPEEQEPASPNYYDTDHGHYSDDSDSAPSWTASDQVDIGFSDSEPNSPDNITNDNPHAVIVFPSDGHRISGPITRETYRRPSVAVAVQTTQPPSRLSPANNPTPKECGHDWCQLSIPMCCACSDVRPQAGRYYTYIDGRGWRPDGYRSGGYCSSCRDRHRNPSPSTAVTFHPSSPSPLSPTSLGTATTERQQRRREFLRTRLANAFGTLQQIADDPAYVSPIDAMFRAEDEALAAAEEVTFDQLLAEAAGAPSAAFAVDNSCRICFAAHIDSLFLPCAHLVCCRRCAMRLTHTLFDDTSIMRQVIRVAPCPICRTKIEGIMKVYRA